MRTGLKRARCRIIIAKNWGIGAAPDLCGRSPIDSTGRTLIDLAGRFCCGFAAGCDKRQWHGCMQESSSDVARRLASGIAAGGCETHCNGRATGSRPKGCLVIIMFIMSCPCHHHVTHKRVNSEVKELSGAKTCVFCG